LTRKFCICDLRKRIYAEASAVLVAAGPGVAPMVRGVVIYDRPCVFNYAVATLKLGLSALASHFGLCRPLTNHGKRGYAKKHAPQNRSPVMP
jgi:hypothetical protein